MKPAWHEVVASLETSMARGPQGSQPSNGANGRVAGGAVVIPRGLPLTWHEPVTEHPVPPPAAAAAPSGRAELLASLERRMSREDEGIAVALVDLDGFKALNHDHGYAAGDRMLAATQSRLEGAVGPAWWPGSVRTSSRSCWAAWRRARRRRSRIAWWPRSPSR